MTPDLKQFSYDSETKLYLPHRLISNIASLVARTGVDKSKMYQLTGQNYDHISNFFTNRNLEKSSFVESEICTHLTKNLASDSRILDIGCGSGVYSQFMARQGFGVTGIDISAAQITNALKNDLENLTLINENIITWDNEGRKFDGVLMNSMLQYILKSDVLNLLSKVRGMLTEDGKIFLIVKINQESTEDFVIKRSHDKASSKIISRYTLLEYLMLFEQAGLDVLHSQKHPHDNHPDQPFVHIVLKKKKQDN